MISSRGTARDTNYLFIDGNYLAERAKTTCVRLKWSSPDIQYQKIGAGFTKVFYYDCLPSRGNAESDDEFKRRLGERHGIFERLRALDGWHVQEGISRSRRNGPATQKEIDILIAVDMLTHVHRKNMDSLTFLAGDQDFRPLLEAVVRDGMYVNLWYHKDSVSSDLRNAADARMEFDMFWLHGQMTDSFRLVNPLPAYSVSQNKFSEPGDTMEIGYANGRQIATLLKNSNVYTLVTDIPLRAYANETSYVFMQTDNDLDQMKRIFEAKFESLEWKPAKR